MRRPVPMRFAMARAGRTSSNRRADPRLRMLQFPVNSKLDSAHGKQRKSGFRPSGLNQVSEPELPFPDPGYLGSGDAVFDAFVNHGIPPSNSEINTAGTALFHAKCIFFPKMDFGNIVAASVLAPALTRSSFILLRSLSNPTAYRQSGLRAPDGTLFLPGELRRSSSPELCSWPENDGGRVEIGKIW